MQNKISDRLTHIVHTCLKNQEISVKEIKDFCRLLQKSCNQLRDEQIFKEKKDEQIFCRNLIKKIIELTEAETKQIFLNDSSQEKKGALLTRLIYASQIFISLTINQHRFGGRLSYHCLDHTRSVTQYPDFLVCCAGANHDIVMQYDKPPDFKSSTIIKMQQDYHQLRRSLTPQDPSKNNVHHLVYSKAKNKIYDLKKKTEQKRLAGWKEGHSEWESFRQMEFQLDQLIKWIEIWDQKNENQEAIKHIKNNIMIGEKDRKLLIKGTIPLKTQFAPPDLGIKMQTIVNVTIIPNPSELFNIDKALQNRLVDLLDHFLHHLKGPHALTFQQALDDIEDARTFYHKVMEEKKEQPSMDLAQIKDKVRSKMRIEKYPSLPSNTRIPHFETLDEAIIESMPPFNDPMKQLIDVPRENFIQTLKDKIVLDAVKHQDHRLLDYFTQRIEHNIIANLDLGSLMEEKADENYPHVLLLLIVEENPYQAWPFFSVNQKLQIDGGAGCEENHLKLRDPAYRKKWGITDEEYFRFLEFLDITYNFVLENISEAIIVHSRLYIYLPMKAVQLALNDPKIKASTLIIKQIDFIIQEFEKAFCIQGKLRDIVLEELNTFIAECSSAGKLCSHLLHAMEVQFGSRFLQAPHEYGFTKGDALDPEFLKEQNDRSIIPESNVTP